MFDIWNKKLTIAENAYGKDNYKVLNRKGGGVLCNILFFK